MRYMSPGDIVITRTEGILSTWLIPGWWTHGGICTENGSIIHATAKGVHESHPLDFLCADYAIVLRYKDMDLAIHAEIIAYEIKGSSYDFDFNFDNSSEFSCTELVMYCYPDWIEPNRRYFGRRVVIADDIVSLADGSYAPFSIVYDTRNSCSH